MNFLANPIPIFNLKFFIYLFLMKDETQKKQKCSGPVEVTVQAWALRYANTLDILSSGTSIYLVNNNRALTYPSLKRTLQFSR